MRGDAEFHFTAFGTAVAWIAGSHCSKPGTAGSLTASVPSSCQSNRMPR